MRMSVIVPVYNGADELGECLRALLAARRADDEIVVVDDASLDDSAEVARAHGVRTLRLPQNQGPAAARNHGVRHATGDVLFFVDADVVVAPDAIARVARQLDDRPDVDAVFGSYDASPRAPGVVSQYRNLLHHYVHQHGDAEAFTFWAGCGAIRRPAFEALAGFDEQMRGIEDVELGYRLRRAGHHILLDKALTGTHLKRWSPWTMATTDVRLRAIPWTRLILESRIAPEDLNLKADQRWSGALVALAAGAMALAPWRPILLAVAMGALGAVAVLNRAFYRFLARARGIRFAVVAFPLHVLYFVCSDVGLLYALASHLVGVRASDLPHDAARARR